MRRLDQYGGISMLSRCRPIVYVADDRALGSTLFVLVSWIHLRLKALLYRLYVSILHIAHAMPMPTVHSSNRCCCCDDVNAPAKIGPCIIRPSRTSELIRPSSEKEKDCGCGSKGSPDFRDKCQGCASWAYPYSHRCTPPTGCAVL
jgi:hypothetical protein